MAPKVRPSSDGDGASAHNKTERMEGEEGREKSRCHGAAQKQRRGEIIAKKTPDGRGLHPRSPPLRATEHQCGNGR